MGQEEMLRRSTSKHVYSSLNRFYCSNPPKQYFIPPLHECENLNKLKFLNVQKTASDVYYLQPNNPPVNALRSEMLTDFETVASEFEKQPPKCIVLCCDVAGANIKEMQNQTPAEAEAYANRAKGVFNKLRGTGAPIIGYVTKFAIGGGLELLMHSDIRYSGPKSILQAPEIELDVFQSFGGTYLLPRFLGSSLALRAQLRNDVISLDEATRCGLITEVIQDSNPQATTAKAFEDAFLISKKKSSVVRRNVNMVRLSETGAPQNDVSALESKGFGETFEGGAFGMKRFLDKYRIEEWGNEKAKVVSGSFKSLGIDSTQIGAFLDIVSNVESDKSVVGLFLSGDVSGGDIKKLHKALANAPSQFSEFLEKEYLWHETMRTAMKKPTFYFADKIIGGGGFGVFNSVQHKISTRACPDVAGTYDLPRLGSVGRAMALAAFTVNGNEAKHFGLTDWLVAPENISPLQATLLDSLVLNPSADVNGILLTHIMHEEGRNLPLRKARVLEYLVWDNMSKADFNESIYSRFILPKKERREPKFQHPNIFEISPEQLQQLHTELTEMVTKLKSNIEGMEKLLFYPLIQ